VTVNELITLSTQDTGQRQTIQIDVARGQDIGNEEGDFESGAESWGQHVGVGRIVCVCFMCLYCLSLSCVLCTQCYQLTYLNIHAAASGLLT
jgi:hypothetical protein